MPLKFSDTALVPGMEIWAEAGTANTASDAAASDLTQRLRRVVDERQLFIGLVDSFEWNLTAEWKCLAAAV